ncbi:hypothetical protein DN395_06035 [Bacillus sp. AR18-7]|nr:hypothetical protein DN395_06035 [Bacillus sp. AR18-7]
MALGGGQCLLTRNLNKQELPLKIAKGLESVLMRFQEIPIRKHILGMLVFKKKPRIRVCKILYSFLANRVTNKNHKTIPE